MKKFGFTLAEVLITLGIIGVIAAITLPTLMTDTQSAQIGPKLAKAVAMFEQANEAMLNENSVDTLTDGDLAPNINQYQANLMNHLKGTFDTTGRFLAKDGIQYRFTLGAAPDNPNAPAHMQRIGDVEINLNTRNLNSDIYGTDVFCFSWWNDGSLRPKGASDWDGGGNADDSWRDKCPLAEDGSVTDPTYCAGHIFENNLKVFYR